MGRNKEQLHEPIRNNNNTLSNQRGSASGKRLTSNIFTTTIAIDKKTND